jgi:hypothetical protein
MCLLVILTFGPLGYVHRGCDSLGLQFMIILQPLFLYRRNQGELVLLATDQLLMEQTEDGCELLLGSD